MRGRLRHLSPTSRVAWAALLVALPLACAAGNGSKVSDAPDLRVSLRAEPSPVSLGDVVVVSTHVVNHGRATAPAVTLRLRLPKSLRATEGTCGRPGPCALGALAPGADVHVTVRALVVQAGTLSLSAAADAGAPDADPRDDRSTTTLTAAAIGPVVCVRLVVSGPPLAVDRPSTLVARLLGAAAAGRTVHASGAGVTVAAKSDADGVARLLVVPRRPGRVDLVVVGVPLCRTVSLPVRA